MNKTNSKLPLLLGTAIVGILVITIIFALGTSKKTDTNTTRSASLANSNGKDTVDYAIDMSNFNFSPNSLSSEAGKSLRIKLTSINSSHNFKIDKLNFDSGLIKQGESKVVTLQIPNDASGTYEVYCAVSNHKSMGMVGKLSINVNSSSMNNDSNSQITDDTSFLENMIPHHKEAIDNSNKIISLTQNVQLKQFAQEVVSAQSKEVTYMLSWYKNWVGKNYVVNTNYKMLMKDMTSMNSNDQDQSYINGMIAHHQSAIDMANKIKTITKRPELTTLATNVIDTQTKEILTLKDLLNTYPTSSTNSMPMH